MSKKPESSESTDSMKVLEAPAISVGTKERAKRKLQELMKEENRTVKGIFQCFESPGASVKICVKKYPDPSKGGIPSFEKVMTDGEIYDVPLYVARHLNGHDASVNALEGGENRNTNIGTCSYPVHGFMMKSKGADPQIGALGSGPQGEVGVPVPLVGISKRVKRYGFQSLEFAGNIG